MFVKPLSKYNKTTEERYSIYQLCESYRLDGRIRQRVIIGLGKLEELPTDGQKIQLGKRIEELLQGKNPLPLGEWDDKVEQTARHFYNEILKRQRYDAGNGRAEWQLVDINTVKNKNAREVGTEWLCKQAFDQLNISNFLRSVQWPEEKINLAATHIISHQRTYRVRQRETYQR